MFVTEPTVSSSPRARTTSRLATFNCLGDRRSFLSRNSNRWRLLYNSMRYDAATERCLTTTGSAGLRSYSLNTTTGALTLISTRPAQQRPPTKRSRGSLHLYGERLDQQPRRGECDDWRLSTLLGRRPIRRLVARFRCAVSPDGGFVYVTSQSGNTVSVFEVHALPRRAARLRRLCAMAPIACANDAPPDAPSPPMADIARHTEGANDMFLFQRDQRRARSASSRSCATRRRRARAC